MTEKTVLGSRSVWIWLACALLGACTDPGPTAAPVDEEQDAWEAFVAAHALQLPNGSYLFEGDVAVSGETLRLLFESQRASTFSTVASFIGLDWTLDAAQRLELTWCNALDFGSKELNERVSNAILDASRDWERATDVNYIYRYGEDGAACEPGANGVLFRVRLGTQEDCPALGCPLASAFFPNDLDGAELLVWPEAFRHDEARFLGYIRHELGHTLGLFHEHGRFEQEDVMCLLSAPPWLMFELTPADGESVMAYSFCNGSIGSHEELTVYDRLGVRYLYGLPRRFGRGETFTFNGGLENDVFWYDPDGAWHLATATGDDWIQFDVTDACDYSAECTEPVANGIPVSAQFRPDVFAESVLVYGRRDLDDVILHNRMPEDLGFLTDPITWDGWYVPLHGRFHDDSLRDDLFFYAPGEKQDWMVHSNPDESWVVIPHPQPLYLDPVVGRFGAENSEIVWRDPVNDTGYVWSGHDLHVFDVHAVDFDARGVKRDKEYIPLYGDFDGDGTGDLFWYAPGTTADKLWISNGSMADPVDVVGLTVNGYYKPIVADFDSNGATDVFWYAEGGRPDALWLFKPGGRYEEVAVTRGGDYAPIAGDFNSDDLCADILWFASDLDLVIPWRSNCDGTFSEQPPITVPADSFPVGYALGR